MQRMTYSAGDAAMQLIADSTQLDAAFKELPVKTEAAMAAAAAGTAPLNEALAATTEQAAGAGAAMVGAAEQVTKADLVLWEAQIRVARATSQNMQAQTELRQAMAAVRQSGGQSASAIRMLAGAQVAAAAAAKELSVAQQAVAVGSQEMEVAAKEAAVSTAFNMREAKAEIKMIGEEIGVKIPKHLQGFVANLPGVGNALNAVFAATAIFMLGKILWDAGERLYELAEKGKDAAHKIEESFGNANRAIREHNNELTVANDKLAIEIAKLEHKPSNMLKLALDEAIVSADKLANSLRKDSEELDKLLKENHVSGFQGFIGMFTGGSMSTKEQEEHLRKVSKGLNDIAAEGQRNAEKATTDDERRAAATETRAKLQAALTKAIGDTEQAVDRLNRQVNEQGQYMSIDPAQLEGPKAMLRAGIEALRQQQHALTLQQENDDLEARKRQDEQKNAAIDNAIQVGEARIAAETKTNNALQDMRIAEAQRDVAQRKITIGAEIAIEQDANEQKFRNDQKALADRVELYEADPTRNAQKIKDLNAEIDANENLHYAKMIQQQAKALQIMVANQQNALALLKTSALPAQIVPTGAVKDLQDLEAAMHSLGTKSESELSAMAHAAEENFKAVRKNVMATKHDVLEAEAAYLDRLIPATEAAGKPTDDLRRRLADLERQLGNTRRMTLSLDQQITLFVRDLIRGSAHVGTAARDIGKSFAAGLGEAAYAAEMGSMYFGQAMQRMLQSTLATISQMCIVESLKEIAYAFQCLANPLWAAATGQTASGHFLAAAKFGVVAAISGVGAAMMNPSGDSQGDGRTYGNGPIQTTGAAGNTDPNPVSSTNIQRFAKGGLVMHPTLAIIGDAIGAANSSQGQREAAIPLDDPAATGAIADAIVARMPNLSGGGSPVFELHGDLVHMVKKISRKVDKRGVQLSSSRSMRVTKKS